MKERYVIHIFIVSKLSSLYAHAILVVHIIQTLGFCFREGTIEKQQFIHHHRGKILFWLHRVSSNYHNTCPCIIADRCFLCASSDFSSIMIDDDTVPAACGRSTNVVEHQMVPLGRDGQIGHLYVISSEVYLIPRNPKNI